MRLLTKLFHGLTVALEDELVALADANGIKAEHARRRVVAHVKRNSLATTLIVSVLAHALGLFLGGL